MYISFLCLVFLGLVAVVRLENCPSGWKKFTNGRCYLFVTTKKNHAQAKAYCEAKGGYLAEPRTMKENWFVAEQIKVRAYIGYVDKAKEGHFVGGHTNTPLTYKNWYSREPNNYKRHDGMDEDCVEINYPSKKNARWNDIFCDYHLSSVCEYNPCPHGWQRKNNKCYFVATEKEPWCKAQVSCAKRGGFLPEPRNHKENTVVAAFHNGKEQWLGLNDNEKEGSFVWDTDGSTPSFTKWIPHEPNNGGGRGENCGEINYKTRGGWNDVTCKRSFNYVCQINP